MRTHLMLAGTLALALVSAPAIFGRDRDRDHDRDVRTTTRDYEYGTSTHRYYAQNAYRNDRDRVYRDGRYYYRNDALPPGLAKRGELPPGLQKHVRERGSLPPGLQKKVDRDDYYADHGRGHNR